MKKINQVPGPTESNEQMSLMRWTDFAACKYPELSLLFHIPNGGLRNKAVAGKLKAEGAKAGVPDLFLPVARGKYYGLFIEFKVSNGKLQRNQKEWLNKLSKQGYATIVCYGFEEAKECLETYLKLKNASKVRG